MMRAPPLLPRPPRAGGALRAPPVPEMTGHAVGQLLALDQQRVLASSLRQFDDRSAALPFRLLSARADSWLLAPPGRPI
jgi:hypothetical protein